MSKDLPKTIYVGRVRDDKLLAFNAIYSDEQEYIKTISPSQYTDIEIERLKNFLENIRTHIPDFDMASEIMQLVKTGYKHEVLMEREKNETRNAE
jgi:hypothetical protein